MSFATVKKALQKFTVNVAHLAFPIFVLEEMLMRGASDTIELNPPVEKAQQVQEREDRKQTQVNLAQKSAVLCRIVLVSERVGLSLNLV
jgi:hypothetical protein